MPRISHLARPVVGVLALLLVALTATLLAVASSARAASAISVSPAIVHADSAVTVSGGKDAASTLTVEMRPPGAVWTTLACAGTGAGSTAWSCAVGGPHPLGDHQIRVTETVDGVPSSAVARFQVVPLAVGAGQAPPPPPPPSPTATVTPTPTVTPTVTPKPTPTVTPTGRPTQTPQPGDDDTQLDTFALPVETATPTATPTPVALAEPVPVDAGSSGGSSRPVSAVTDDPAAPSVLDGAVTTLQEIIRNPLTIAVAAGLGGLILLLVAIPANILDATIEANWERITAPFGRLVRFGDRVKKLTAKLPRLPFPAPLVIVLATVAFGFSSPDFGVDLTSLRMTLALALGLILVVFVPIAVTRAAMGRRWHVPARVVARPGAFVLALLGVIASRTVGFSPGILVGLVLGLELARSARAEDRTRATTIRLGTTLGVAFAAWLGYSALHAVYGGSSGDVLGQLTLETLGAAASEGLAGVMVAILPVTFLEGRDLFNEARRRWFALALPASIAFALIVLPSVTTAQGPRQPIGLWIGVLVVFSLLVLAIWSTFRILEARHPWESGEEATDGRSTEQQKAPAR